MEESASSDCSDSTEVIEAENESRTDGIVVRRIPLSSLREVRIELAHVYRMMDRGEIETQDGTRRAYVLKTIQEVIISSDIEKRLIALEDRNTLPGSAKFLPAATH